MQGQGENIAGSCPVEGETCRLVFTRTHRERGAGNAETQQLGAKDARDLSTGSTPQLCFVFLDHDEIWVELRRHSRQCLDIGVFAIAGVAQNQAEASVSAAQALSHRQKAAQTLRIMSIVDENSHAG